MHWDSTYTPNKDFCWKISRFTLKLPSIFLATTNIRAFAMLIRPSYGCSRRFSPTTITVKAKMPFNTFFWSMTSTLPWSTNSPIMPFWKSCTAFSIGWLHGKSLILSSIWIPLTSSQNRMPSPGSWTALQVKHLNCNVSVFYDTIGDTNLGSDDYLARKPRGIRLSNHLWPQG